MIRLLFISLIVLFSLNLLADNDLSLFKEHTKNIIEFLNNDQDIEDVKYVDISIKEKKKTYKKAKKEVFKPVKYDFSHTTPYGEFKVLIFENSKNAFKVSFEAQYPIQQYQIMDTTNKVILVKQSINDKKSYSFEVERTFAPKYILILSQYKDNFLTQNIIPLYKKANIKYK